MRSPGREILLAGAAAVVFTLACFWIGYWTGDPAVSVLSDAGDTAKLLTLTVGVPAAFLALFNHWRGVRQQRDADLWRRREYVAKVFADLEASEQNRFCMAMLDYEWRLLVMPGTTERRRVTENDLLTALAPRAEHGVYHTHDALIRDAFDGFFNTLDRIGAMLAAGLVDWKDIEPYAAYWLKLLDRGPRERSEVFGPIIRRYIDKYQSENLVRLMEKAGVKAAYSKDDAAIVEAFRVTLPVLPEPGEPTKAVPAGGAAATAAAAKRAAAKLAAAQAVAPKPAAAKDAGASKVAAKGAPATGKPAKPAPSTRSPKRKQGPT
jgi:hypothetical protein